MFKKINFGDIKSTCVGIGTNRKKTKAIDDFCQIVFDNFGKIKLMNGTAELYLLLPSENEADYSEEEKKQIAQVLRKAHEEMRISCCDLRTIVWVIEYDVHFKKCIDFFPMDRALTEKIEDVEEALNKNRIVRVK